MLLGVGGHVEYNREDRLGGQLDPGPVGAAVDAEPAAGEGQHLQ